MLRHKFADATYHFQLQFNTRGWTIQTNSSDLVLGFRCDCLHGSINSFKRVAFEAWQSLQQEEILRTSVPLVQDSTIARHGRNFSLSRRMIQVQIGVEVAAADLEGTFGPWSTHCVKIRLSRNLKWDICGSSYCTIWCRSCLRMRSFT